MFIVMDSFVLNFQITFKKLYCFFLATVQILCHLPFCYWFRFCFTPADNFCFPECSGKVLFLFSFGGTINEQTENIFLADSLVDTYFWGFIFCRSCPHDTVDFISATGEIIFPLQLLFKIIFSIFHGSSHCYF